MEGEEEEMERVREVMRDRFRLSSISIAQYQAKTCGLEISEPVIACLADLAFKYSEQLAKDVERFAHHGGRKSVNTEDVILSAHRNERLAISLRSFCNELKLKEPPSLKKRKKLPGKEVRPNTSTVHISDL